MSRVSTLEKLKIKKKSALEFHFEELWAPPIMTLFTPQDIQELIRIATSVRYNGNINKKYELIDAVMKQRGFRKLAAGTNRVVYRFLEDARFVAKVAVDRVGMKDSPAEFRNQMFFQPFCCRVFEVDPSGVIAFVERVNPISSLEEFFSVKDDAFNMMITKIIGKYVVDDLGSETYMNFGVRQDSNGHTFGPVIIDFPYVYELDGAKLKCQSMRIDPYTGRQEVCNGDIDYNPGFNGLSCKKCGRSYKARDLSKGNATVKFIDTSVEKALIKQLQYQMRVRIIDNGKVVMDSGRESRRYLTEEEYEMINSVNIKAGDEIEVGKTVYKKKQKQREYRDQYYTALQKQYFDELQKKNAFNPVIKKPDTDVEVTTTERIDKKKAKKEQASDESLEFTWIKNNGPMEVDVEGTYDIKTGDLIEYLEAETFPELAVDPNKDSKDDEEQFTLDDLVNKEDTEEDVTVDTKHQDTEEAATAPVTAKPTDDYSVNSDGLVYTDDQVAKMVEENRAAHTDKEVSRESTALNPEADKIPEDSPITRPYMDPTVNVEYTDPTRGKSTYAMGYDLNHESEEEEEQDVEDDSVEEESNTVDLSSYVDGNPGFDEDSQNDEDEEEYDSEDEQEDDAEQEEYDDYEVEKFKKYVTQQSKSGSRAKLRAKPKKSELNAY